MSAISVEFEDLLLGKPDQLEPRAQSLVNAAEAITRATESLRALVEGQTSQATDAVARTASEVARSLSRARTRYRDTGAALQEFAVNLRPIQTDARSALSTAEYYDQRNAALPYEIADAQGELVRAEAMEATPTAIARVEDEIRRLQNAQSNAYTQLRDARTRLHGLRDQLRAIADTAIAKIQTAIEGDRDSFRDNWNQFWESAAGWIGEWAAGILKGVLEFLGELLAVLIAIVVVVLLIVLVVFVLSFLPGVLLLIAAGLALLAVAALLITFRVRETNGTPQLVAGGQRQTERHPRDADAAEDGDDYSPRDYGDLFEDVGRQDARGGSASTVIRVVAITDDDGNVIAWRVQLPSTQNWSPFNTDGALNDLSADAMLALFLGLETQYEKAVWDALERSGALADDAPLLLTGWSLGGMMAGDLASDPRISDRVQSVVTAGSPIDKHADAIDPSVRVTQVNNRWDPVHTLEFVGYDDQDVPGENWQTYRPTDIRIHASGMYGELADDYVPEVRPGDEIFFADDVEGTNELIYEYGYRRG